MTGVKALNEFNRTEQPRSATTFGDKVRHRRITLNLSQQELAKMIDVNMASISNWETGEHLPQLDKRRKLATAFGWTDEELIAGTEFVVTPQESQPMATRVAYLLGNGKLNGRPAPGSVPGFSAMVQTTMNFEEITAAWSTALVDTAQGLKVDPKKALAYLADYYGVITSNMEVIEPELAP